MGQIKEIVSTDQNYRVVIFERDDGRFSFAEEQKSPDQPEPTWRLRFAVTNVCDTVETAEKEAGSRVEWLRRELAWPARHSLPVEVIPRKGTIIDCPYCGYTFLIKDRSRWAEGRHLTCGQQINLVDKEPPRSE